MSERLNTTPIGSADGVDHGREANHDRAEVMAYAGKADTEIAMEQVVSAEDFAIIGQRPKATEKLSEARSSVSSANSKMETAGQVYDQGQAVLNTPQSQSSPEGVWDFDHGREANHDRAEVMAYAGKVSREGAMQWVNEAEDRAINGQIGSARALDTAEKIISNANALEERAGQVYDQGQAILGK